MSLAEIKKEIAAMSPEEREELRRYLIIQHMRNDREWQAELSRRIEEVKNGTYAAKQDLEALHAKLIAVGR